MHLAQLGGERQRIYDLDRQLWSAARGLMWIGVLAGMAQTKQVARVGRRA
jgi:hypothetical protein